MQYRLGQVYYMLGDYRRALDFFGRNVATLESHLRTQRVANPAFLSCFPASGGSGAVLSLASSPLALPTEKRRSGPQRQPITPTAASRPTRDRPPLPARKGDMHQAIFMLERGLELARSGTS